MAKSRADAAREFRRMMMWIVVLAVLMVIGSLAFEASQGVLGVPMALATIFGVFFAMLLGAGLCALAFFSDKSGHDETVTRATQRDEPEL
ncbi:MAG: hypothetical protein ABIT09_02055 [Croceibacterium sp.]